MFCVRYGLRHTAEHRASNVRDCKHQVLAFRDLIVNIPHCDVLMALCCRSVVKIQRNLIVCVEVLNVVMEIIHKDGF